MLGLDIAYWHTKFNHSSFSHCGYMVGAYQNLNGSRNLTMPLSRTVCHPWASTYYGQPIYQIWSLHLYALRRYTRRYKIAKMGWFRVVRGHSMSLKIALFDRTYTNSYYCYAVICLYLAPFLRCKPFRAIVAWPPVRPPARPSANRKPRPWPNDQSVLF